MGIETLADHKKNKQPRQRSTQLQRQPMPSPDGSMPHEVPHGVVDPRHLTPSAVTYLQRTAGNRAVSQLLTGTPTIQRTPQTEVKSRTPKKATVVQRDREDSEDSSTVTWRDIMDREIKIMHSQMFPWLEAEAEKDGMATLVHGLTNAPFNINQKDDDIFKRNALRAQFIGWNKPFTLASLKEAITSRSIKTLWMKRKVNWQTVSMAILQMHQMKKLGKDIWKYREGWDKTVISSGLIGGTSGFAVGSIRTLSASPGAGLTQGLNTATSAGYGVGVIGSTASAIGHGIEAKDRNLSMEERVMEGGKTGASLLDASWQGAGIGKFLGASGAMGAAGALSIGAGAAYLGIGTYRGIDSAIKSHKLGKIEKSYDEPQWNYGSRDIVGRAAGFGKETKQASAVAYGAAAAMGGAMIAGGVLLLASNPVGWTILAIAGGIGAAGAIYKYLRWRSRKKELTDKLLGIDRSQFKGKAREELRKEKLQQMGFISVDQFYQSHLWLMASSLYQRAKQGDERASAVIKHLGVKLIEDLPPEKQIQKIAQKLEY